MGGFLSGGGRGAPKTGDLLALDLADLKRLGVLENGRRQTITWSHANGDVCGRVSVACFHDHAQLEYCTRTDNRSDWEDVNERVQLVYTNPHLGGSRPWFQCPTCGRHCRILYGSDPFRCRQCHGAVYRSQYQADWELALSRSRALRKRLGGSGDPCEAIPEKPKWMRWSTYERLCNNIYETDDAWLEGALSFFCDGE